MGLTGLWRLSLQRLQIQLPHTTFWVCSRYVVVGQASWPRRRGGGSTRRISNPRPWCRRRRRVWCNTPETPCIRQVRDIWRIGWWFSGSLRSSRGVCACGCRRNVRMGRASRVRRRRRWGSAGSRGWWSAGLGKGRCLLSRPMERTLPFRWARFLCRFRCQGYVWGGAGARSRSFLDVLSWGVRIVGRDARARRGRWGRGMLWQWLLLVSLSERRVGTTDTLRDICDNFCHSQLDNYICCLSKTWSRIWN